MSTQEQTIIELKSRVLDLTDALNAERQTGQTLHAALTEIVKTVGVEGDETGQIQLEAVVEAVRALVLKADDEYAHTVSDQAGE